MTIWENSIPSREKKPVVPVPETDLVCSQDEKEASEAEESGQWGRVEGRAGP